MDFFPYADNQNSFWTGYYVSRAQLKGAIRRTTALLRSADALFAVVRPWAGVWQEAAGAALAQYVQRDGEADAAESSVAAARSPAKMDNSVFWLGDDRIVYRADGYQPIRISTHAIEQQIGGYETVSDAVGWVYEQEGHVFYVLSFPTAGETWVYDLASQLWHERESEGYGTWRCITGANVFGSAIAGDAVNGALYVIDPTASMEVADQIIRVATGTCMHAEGLPVTFTKFQAELTTGNGTPTGQARSASTRRAARRTDRDRRSAAAD